MPKPIPNLTQAKIDHFWSWVDISKDSSACWEWRGTKSRLGYGRYKINQASFQAHRLALHLSKRPADEFLMACHSCDNRVCCNPKHLFWASQKENVLDMYVKGRQNRPNGEAHGRAKLTAAEVLQIRQLAGSMTNVELASRFNISPDHAHKILVRKIWKHLEESR